MERHLRFLAQCRGAFSRISELQVALMDGFFSHLAGLIDAAVNCLQMIDPVNVVQMTEDGDAAIQLICKLCGLLVMVPGGLEQEVPYIPKCLLSFLDSQSWVLPRMKAEVLSAIVFLSAALSQDQLLYHAVSAKVICNYQLFNGVPSYHQELLSLSCIALQGIANIVMQESSKAIRGKLALESCNCVALSFTVSDETLEECSKLVEIAKSCLSADDKFLLSTIKFLDALQFHL